MMQAQIWEDKQTTPNYSIVVAVVYRIITLFTRIFSFFIRCGIATLRLSTIGKNYDVVMPLMEHPYLDHSLVVQ